MSVLMNPDDISYLYLYLNTNYFLFFRFNRFGQDFAPKTMGETVIYGAMLGASAQSVKICYQNFTCERPDLLKNDLEKNLQSWKMT